MLVGRTSAPLTVNAVSEGRCKPSPSCEHTQPEASPVDL